MEKGLWLLESKKWSEANILMTQLSENEPNNEIYKFFKQQILDEETEKNPNFFQRIFEIAFDYHQSNVGTEKILKLSQNYWLEQHQDLKLTLEDCEYILNKNQHYEPMHHRKSIILSKMGKPQESLKCIERLLQINSTNLQGWQMKGNLLEQQNEEEEAMACYNRAINIETLEITSYINKAKLLVKQKQYQNALLIYDLILQINKSYYDIFLKRGELLEKLDEQEGSLANYKIALKLKPDYYLISLKLADCLKTLSHYDESIKFYDKVIILAPNQSIISKAYNNKGELLLIMDEMNLALSCFENAIKTDNQNIDALLNLGGKVVQEMQHNQKALLLYEKVLSICPKNVDALQRKGEILTDQENFQEALKYIEQVLQISPNLKTILNKSKIKLYKVKCLHGLNQLKQALELCEQYSDRLKYFSNFCFLKGNILFNLKKYELALISYNEALELEPFQCETLYNKGINKMLIFSGCCLFNLCYYDEAIEVYDLALLFRPTYESALVSKGDCLRLKGKYEEAILCYNYDQYGTDSALRKAKCLRKLRRYPEALLVVEKLLKNDPNNLIVQQQKVKILTKQGEILESNQIQEENGIGVDKIGPIE